MSYQGLLDEWLYAARILTDAEVAERFNNGFGSTANGGTGNAFTPPVASTPSVSVPSGGTAARPVIGGVIGQLYFNTDTQTLEYWDGDDWVPVAPGLDEIILKSLIDAKGDLIAGTADDTPARVAVGTDGQLLTADSGAAAGVSWQPPGVSLATAFSAKGDLLAGTGPGAYAVLPVGPPGALLFADPSEPTGLRWDFLTERVATPPPIVVEARLPAPVVARDLAVLPPPLVVEVVLPTPQVVRSTDVAPPPIEIGFVLPAPVVAVDAAEPGLAELRAKFRAGSLSGTLSDGDPITTLTDESGNGRSLSEAGGNRPAYKAGSGPNGLDWIDFATGKWLESTVNDVLPLAGAEFVVFALWRGGAANNIVWAGGSGTNGQAAMLQIQSTTGYRHDFWNLACTTVTSTLGNWKLTTLQLKGGTAKQWEDGVLQTTQARASSLTTNHFLLGRLTTAHFESFNGGIVEVRVYGALSDPEIDAINALLMSGAGL